MGNPAEETYCYPNNLILKDGDTFCQHRNNTVLGHECPTFAANPVADPSAFPGPGQDVARRLNALDGDFTFAQHAPAAA